MMKRLFWFCLGVVSGAAGLMWLRRKAIAAAEKITPSAILSVLIDSAKSLVTRLVALYGKSGDTSSATVPPEPRQP
jgi:hypothetical protein